MIKDKSGFLEIINQRENMYYVNIVQLGSGQDKIPCSVFEKLFFGMNIYPPSEKGHFIRMSGLKQIARRLMVG